jgi:hypothetical protein
VASWAIWSFHWDGDWAMYINGYMLLVIYLFAAGAFLISLWMFLTLDEMKENGKKWVELNQELIEKIKKLEYQSLYKR